MDFDTAKPIYRQIIDGYQKKLIRGELKPGDKIPSQREYAEMVRVNPNTVQRAYREMELMGMVETQRGQGTFITVTEAMMKEMKASMADSVVKGFLSEMKELGFSELEIRTLLDQQMEMEGKAL